MRIVAFGGLAQAGKSTAANMLARTAFENGYTPRMERFAGPLKDACAALGADKDARPDLYRKFCQYVGGNFRDPEFSPPHTGPDYWVELTDTRFRKLEAAELEDRGHDNWHETLVIVDDVRYQNEIDLIRKWGGTLVFIDGWRRLGLPTDPEQWDKWRRDPSEDLAINYSLLKEPDQTFDFIVTNNGSAAELEEIVQTMRAQWCGEIAADRARE